MAIIPIEHIITEVAIGVASIAAGVFGLVFLDYKFNKPDDVKVFYATSLLSFIFWIVILTDIMLDEKVMFIGYSAIALSLCTGFGAAKLTEIYGARGHTIPRFLLGFFLSWLVVYSLLGGPRFRLAIYTIIGCLFSPISFLTLNFILAFIVVFGFSSLISNGLIILGMVAIPYNRNFIYASFAIGTILGLARLYYYSKEDSHESNVISDAVADAERQPITSDENPSYSAVLNED